MYHLIESPDKEFMEAVSSALWLYGVEASVYLMGSSPDGTSMYSVVCPVNSSRKGLGLINGGADFIKDLDTESSYKLMSYRNDRESGAIKLFTSKRMALLSKVSFVILVLGVTIEYLIEQLV